MEVCVKCGVRYVLGRDAVVVNITDDIAAAAIPDESGKVCD
jgi:hypothetical protein